MAITTFAGVKFDPELFMQYLEELSPNPSALVQSGILRNDSTIASRITEGGNKVTVPNYKPLSGASQNYDGSDITVNGIDSGSQTAIVIGRANAWGADDLSAELATKDPMRSIAEKVATYWREERQRILIKMLTGIIAATTFKAKHVLDISATADIADANRMSASAIIDAGQQALGDNFKKLKALAVHSVVYANLVKQNLVNVRPLGEQKTDIPMFLDYALVLDDTLPVSGTGAATKYTSLLFGPGAVGEAAARVKNAVEIGRDPLTNGGFDFMVNRNRWVYHPYGLSFKGTPAGISPTDAELAAANNWEMVYDTKNVPIAALITNG